MRFGEMLEMPCLAWASSAGAWAEKQLCLCPLYFLTPTPAEMSGGGSAAFHGSNGGTQREAQCALALFAPALGRQPEWRSLGAEKKIALAVRGEERMMLGRNLRI